MSPSELLKKIIIKSPKNTKYPKCFDKSDPKVYDINNYDANSFKSCGVHNHPGMELDEYFKNIFPKENSVFIEKTEPNIID
jgi:hypothetical protein